MVAYGPEARAFVQSGLSERLAQDYELVFGATDPESPALRDAPGRVVSVPQVAEPAPLARLRRLRARRNTAAVRAAESMAARAVGGSGAWRRWLREQRVDGVLAAAYNSARTLPALDSADRLGIPSVVLTNSWKDVHQKPHCGPALAGLGVFAESERRAFLAANPSASAANLRSIGSLHCAALLRAEALPRAALDWRLERPFVVYAAAQDGEQERDLVNSLLDLLAVLPGRPRLVVRLNPMDRAEWTERLYGDRDDVVFERPAWSWSPEREWICPLPQDAPRWSSLLRHAAAIVSRPSTVVWEAAAVGRRTVTPAWGASGRAWSAEHFAEARSRGWVRGVAEEGDLQAALAAEIECPQPPAIAPVSNPVERACSMIGAALSVSELPASGLRRTAPVPALPEALR